MEASAGRNTMALLLPAPSACGRRTRPPPAPTAPHRVARLQAAMPAHPSARVAARGSTAGALRRRGVHMAAGGGKHPLDDEFPEFEGSDQYSAMRKDLLKYMEWVKAEEEAAKAEGRDPSQPPPEIDPAKFVQQLIDSDDPEVNRLSKELAAQKAAELFPDYSAAAAAEAAAAVMAAVAAEEGAVAGGSGAGAEGAEGAEGGESDFEATGEAPDMMELEDFDNLPMTKRIELFGMGRWKLAAYMDAPFHNLAAQIEGAWREMLSPIRLIKLAPDHKWADSADPSGEMTRAWPIDSRLPKEYEDRIATDRGWMQIENRAYESEAFRYLHLEVARAPNIGLQVLHCVMFPRASFDLPIVAMDMVSRNGVVTLAICDASPVSPDMKLPGSYDKYIKRMLEQFNMGKVERKLPDWGKAIFSAHCVCISPRDEAQLGDFIRFAVALTRFHVELGAMARPILSQKTMRTRVIAQQQARYCDLQMQNDKTSTILASSYSEEFAKRYMTEVMFPKDPDPTATMPPSKPVEDPFLGWDFDLMGGDRGAPEDLSRVMPGGVDHAAQAEARAKRDAGGGGDRPSS